MLEELRRRIVALTEERAAKVAGLETITRNAEAGDRNLTAAEDADFSAAVADVKAIDVQLGDFRSRVAELEETERQVATANRLAPFDFGSRGSSTRLAGAQGEAMRSLEASHSARLVAPNVAEVIERSVRRDQTGGVARQVAALADPAYFSGFVKWMADPTRGHMLWTEAERQAFQRVEEERTAFSVGSNLGTLVPVQVDASFILSGAGSISPFRSIAKVERIPSGNTYRTGRMPQLSGAYVAEGTESTDNGTQLVAVDVKVHTARVFALASYEMLSDLPSLASELGMGFADALNQLETTQFTLGDGTTEPQGLILALDGTASEVAPTTAEAFAVADVYKVLEALPARHRQRASWMSNLNIINDIRQFATADSHAMLSRLAEDSPEQMLGKPFFENSAMDDGFDPAVTADNHLLVVGDFSKYCIVDSGPASITTHELTGAGNRYPTGQRGFLYWQRTGGAVLDDGAFRVLNVATVA